MRAGLVGAVVVLAASPAFAHRLDEYLQATLISVDKNRLNAQMILTPGVAVFPFLIAEIDTDRDGVISEGERHSYAVRVLRDLLLTSDGQRLTPRLLSLQFPAIEEMKDGRGEIRLEFEAFLPGGVRRRRLSIENRHQNRISAYLVNCLVPRDPNILIRAQNRNYSQSLYQLEYDQTDVWAISPLLGMSSGILIWLVPVVLLLFCRLMFVRRQARSAGALFAWFQELPPTRIGTANAGIRHRRTISSGP